jgi:formate dehydrogenase iron-sulfur subunit
MGLMAAIGFVHHIVEGPNKVSPEDEEAAKRLAGSGRP